MTRRLAQAHFDGAIKTTDSKPLTPKRASAHCHRCFLPSRWCTCPGLTAISSALQIDVLMHPREIERPSSTGHLIHRTVDGSRLHPWHRDVPLDSRAIKIPGRELWILHPSGGPVPSGIAPEKLQILLLDGSWREATSMARETRDWGRVISLPLEGKSRFWLREQREGNRFSTIEALLYLLGSLELKEMQTALRIQFELHVYSSLRSRGRKPQALEFLKDSCLPSALPEFLAHLNNPRPC